MAEFLEESSGLESNTIGVFRSAATVEGGKRFSFGALVAVGDRNGQVALGYAKSKEVPPAIEKAQKEAKRQLRRIPLQGGTIPHEVIGKYGASMVKLVPAAPGTGVVAGATVRALLELVGVTDCLTKAYGSTNKKNLAKATMAGLERLRAKDAIATNRGIALGKTHVDGLLESGAAAMPKAPVRREPRETQRGGDRRGGRGKGGPRGGPRGGQGGGRSDSGGGHGGGRADSGGGQGGGQGGGESKPA